MSGNVWKSTRLRSLFTGYHSQEREDEEQHAQAYGYPEQGLLDSPALCEHPARILASQAA